MESTAKCVSAPGKVLLAGGYLVLDRAHTALVFGLDARIHVHIQDSARAAKQNIVVVSPQFKHSNWQYSYETTKEGVVSVSEIRT